MDRVLVIGGTGFIGEYLLKKLNQRKNIFLQTIYKTTSPLSPLKNVIYLKLNGSKEKKRLFEILERTDYLIILSRPDKKLIENIIKSKASFKKILYASTLLIYPNSPLKQNENTKPAPGNEYEKDKVMEEKMLIKFAEESGNKLTIARLTNVYGDIKSRALIHWILTAIISNTKFILNNQGNPVRDFIFVEDVARYIEALIFLSQKNPIEIYNVSTGKGYNILQVISEAEKIAGKKIKIKKGLVTNEKMSVIGDNQKIIKKTGIKAKFSLKEGLKKAYQNYLNVR